MNTKEKREQKEEARKALIEQLGIKPGDVIYSVIRKVSSSGMSRQIDFYFISEGKPYWISRRIAQILDYSVAESGALKVRGCGMDMCFAVVYNLASQLWPGGDGNYKTRRNGMTGVETDGGYLLKSEVL